MPTYVIDGKRYNSPTPLSEDDLLELSGGSKTPTEQSSTLQKIGRTADDLVRAAANGITFGWADRLAAKGNAALGSGDYASNVKQERQLSSDAQARNPYVYKGVEIGSGLVVPGMGLVKGASTGARVANAAANGAIYGGLAGSGEASGDTDVLQALKNTGTGAAIGATVGTVATPVINKGLELASRFSPKVDQALTQGAIARTYKNNPNAAVDAEITRDIGLIKGGKAGDVKPLELNDLQKRYIDQTKQLADKAGLVGETEQLSFDRFRSLLADPEAVAKLESTPTGIAILDNLKKANRTYELTQAAEANNGVIPKLARTTVDSGILDALIMGTTGVPVPIATAARQGIKKALGSNSTRQEVAAALTSPRGLKAADQFLETAGPSNATKGLGILRQAADDAASAKAAQEAADAAAATSKAAKDPNQAISELQATDPTYLLGLSNPNGVPRNDRQMREFSDVLKAQMEARASQEDKAKAGILNAVKERMGVQNRSGALRNLETGFGMEAKDLDKVLTKLADENPEMKDVVQALYTQDANIPRQQLFDLSDILAQTTGKKFSAGGPGILNQTTPGVLYNGSNVSVGIPDVSKMIYAMPDDQVAQLLGREADTLGKGIENAKGYLTTRASRALETFTNGGTVPEADKALLKALGLI